VIRHLENLVFRLAQQHVALENTYMKSVTADAVPHDVVVKERIAQGVQQVEAVAEPSAIPVPRDKVVLNVVDALQSWYDGGLSANPELISETNMFSPWFLHTASPRA